MRRRTSDVSAHALDMKRLNPQHLTLLLGNHNLDSLSATAPVCVCVCSHTIKTRLDSHFV